MTNIKGIKDTIFMARKQKGYTQKEMAEKLNISQPAYSYYEKGEKPLPVNQLDKVLDILEVEVSELDLKEVDPIKDVTRALNRIGDVLEKIYEKM